MKRTINQIPDLTESEKKRFLKCVPNNATDRGCLEWSGSAFKNGYGLFYMKGRDERANRIAFKIAHGYAPTDKFVCHHCDNRICVNPEHLYEETQKQNMQDASRRNRMPTGLNHHAVKYPERRLTGDKHWSRHKPECIARGDRSGARTHPESICKGEDCGKSKLTEAQVIEIRSMYAAGASGLSLAKKFNTVPGNICFIIHRKTWKHI